MTLYTATTLAELRAAALQLCDDAITYFRTGPSTSREAAEAAVPPIPTHRGQLLTTGHAPPRTSLSVAARLVPDDQSRHFAFDAAPWFVTAGWDRITALAACGFRGDYAADAVAHDLAMTGATGAAAPSPVIVEAFAYLESAPLQLNGDPNGFEVIVDPDDAMQWLRAHRPTMAAEIERAHPDLASRGLGCRLSDPAVSYPGFILDDATTRVNDGDHILAEVTARGTTEDLYALRAEYVAGEHFLHAFYADCAIRVVKAQALPID